MDLNTQTKIVHKWIVELILPNQIPERKRDIAVLIQEYQHRLEMAKSLIEQYRLDINANLHPDQGIFPDQPDILRLDCLSADNADQQHSLIAQHYSPTQLIEKKYPLISAPYLEHFKAAFPALKYLTANPLSLTDLLPAITKYAEQYITFDQRSLLSQQISKSFDGKTTLTEDDIATLKVLSNLYLPIVMNQWPTPIINEIIVNHYYPIYNPNFSLDKYEALFLTQNYTKTLLIEQTMALAHKVNLYPDSPEKIYEFSAQNCNYNTITAGYFHTLLEINQLDGAPSSPIKIKRWPEIVALFNSKHVCDKQAIMPYFADFISRINQAEFNELIKSSKTTNDLEFIKRLKVEAPLSLINSLADKIFDKFASLHANHYLEAATNLCLMIDMLPEHRFSNLLPETKNKVMSALTDIYQNTHSNQLCKAHFKQYNTDKQINSLKSKSVKLINLFSTAHFEYALPLQISKLLSQLLVSDQETVGLGKTFKAAERALRSHKLDGYDSHWLCQQIMTEYEAQEVDQAYPIIKPAADLIKRHTLPKEVLKKSKAAAERGYTAL